MMNSYEAHPRYEETQYHDYGFDLQEDFSQFLEEARQHGKEEKLKSSSSSSVHPEESRAQVKEKKKSWKISLVSWLKSENKSSTSKNKNKNNNNNNSTQSNAYHNNNKNHHGNVTGTLTSFFKGTKRKESGEIPYMSLHHGNHAKSQNYGPLYIVT
ncbi:hypothetical protein PIB30_068771 [Stylosanthes scabra]|uniref:Uncharacterized protein n=1 Tax=Stylosanthes scabra TaxID=79078 RepID=A0ABU6QNN1_9FABA|nr:hypothetical protein [Stylosanthes scabra]